MIHSLHSWVLICGEYRPCCARSEQYRNVGHHLQTPAHLLFVTVVQINSMEYCCLLVWFSSHTVEGRQLTMRFPFFTVAMLPQHWAWQVGFVLIVGLLCRCRSSYRRVHLGDKTRPLAIDFEFSCLGDREAHGQRAVVKNNRRSIIFPGYRPSGVWRFSGPAHKWVIEF